ncbi:MAG: DUF4280 domain-containing protein [Ilumatobacteraceae bacterium]
MGIAVVNGAMTACSFGAAPGTLTVLPAGRVMAENQPMASIQDSKPFVNIAPFGVCLSLANPITASQTSAALGVLTPGTCTPMTASPWTPGSPTVMVGGAPALNNSCTCACSYGGVITITNPGATKEQVP